jgi:hypothetical protein
MYRPPPPFHQIKNILKEENMPNIYQKIKVLKTTILS